MMNIYLAILVLIFSLLPFVNIRHWFVRDLGFGRIQLFVLSGIGFSISLILVFVNGMGLHYATFIWLFSVLVNGKCIFAFSPLVKKQVKTALNYTNELTIFSMNVLESNRDYSKISKAIKRLKPDVVVLLETNSNWVRQLQANIDEYRYHFVVPMENRYGISILSQYELTQAQYRFLVEKDVPSVSSIINFNGKEIAFFVAHPPPPSPTEYATSKERDNELKILAKEIGALNIPTIITGDLNDVAWSATTKAFLRVSGLGDPRIGRGFYNTFNADHWWMRFPVDHIFCSKDFEIIEIKRSEYLGSDHFGLITKLSLK